MTIQLNEWRSHANCATQEKLNGAKNSGTPKDTFFRASSIDSTTVLKSYLSGLAVDVQALVSPGHH